MEIISCHNRRPVLDFVIKIFIQADTKERAGDIPQILISVPFQTADGIVTALSRAAVQVYRDILWNFFYSLAELA